MSNVTSVSIPFEPAVLLARLDGDADFMAQLIELFLAEVPGQLDGLRAFVADGDAPCIRRSAHTFKGAIANFTAGDSWRAAHALELAGKQEELLQVPRLLSELERAIEALVGAMRSNAASVL